MKKIILIVSVMSILTSAMAFAAESKVGCGKDGPNSGENKVRNLSDGIQEPAAPAPAAGSSAGSATVKKDAKQPESSTKPAVN